MVDQSPTDLTPERIRRWLRTLDRFDPQIAEHKQRVLMGSHNWSGGVTLNCDPSLIFDGADVANYFRDAFQIDWARASRPIIPETALGEVPRLAEPTGADPPASALDRRTTGIADTEKTTACGRTPAHNCRRTGDGEHHGRTGRRL